MGGPTSAEKANTLQTFTYDFFAAHGLEVDSSELEENLSGYFEEAFNVYLEDDSPALVAKDIVNLYRELSQGSLIRLEKLRSTSSAIAAAAAARRANHNNQNDSSDDDDDDDDNNEGDNELNGEDDAMEMDISRSPVAKLEPVIDEDGFELVQKKKRGK